MKVKINMDKTNKFFLAVVLIIAVATAYTTYRTIFMRDIIIIENIETKS